MPYKSKYFPDIPQCKYFSKLAGETTDVSQAEQLSLSVRFIKDTKAHEKLYSLSANKVFV